METTVTRPWVKNLEKVFPFAVFKGDICRNEEVGVGEMYTLGSLLAEVKPNRALEIGAWTGSCTCMMGLFMKEYGGMLYSIDNFKGSPGSDQFEVAARARQIFLRNIKDFGLEKTVIFLEGDSDSFSDMALDFDFIFIDADHRYSQVKKDIDNYYPKLRKGGMIVGHDFNSTLYDEDKVELDYVDGVHHGVTKAVTEKFSKEVKFFIREENGHKSMASSLWHVIKGG